jgi:PAS domain S-box-containing protein
LVNSSRAAPIPLEETLAKINVPSLISNRDGLVTWQNEAASNTLGDLRGKAFTDIVAPEYVPTVRRQLARKLRGVPVTDYEVEIFTPDGRRRQVEISSVPIRGGDDCQAVFGVVLPARQPVKHGKVELTPRQREVLGYLAAGASTADIASALHISKETVRNHVRQLLRALGVHSRLEAVAVAHNQGMLSTDK